MEVHYSSIREGLQLSSGPLEKAVLYNKITTVCACGPTHILIRTHTHAQARSRMHIFSSVGLHFLIRTHTRTRLRTRGVMGHGPQCFRLLTHNTTHCKNLEKIAKTYG